MYDKWKQGFIDANVDFINDRVEVILDDLIPDNPDLRKVVMIKFAENMKKKYL
jgi:hypothetical protein